MRDLSKSVHAVLEKNLETNEKTAELVPDDGDIALTVADQIENLTVDPATDRKLLWKIDLYVCSMLCFIYAIQFMDKQTNSYASIMGLREDLDMVGNRYSWVASAFYLGYLVFELPAAYALQRLPIAKVTAAFIVVWGIVLATTGASQNYAGFMAARTLLGCLESAITPSFMLITAQWYKRDEHFFRTSMWSMCNGFGMMIGIGIAHGLASRQESGSLPIEGWRLLYVIIGVVTIVAGIIFGLHMPDTPMKAWFLSEDERLMVVARIRDNKQGFGNPHFKLDQVKEVFMDPHTYIYFFFSFFSEIPNGSLTNFGSILLTGMGYDTLEAYVMQLPQGAVEVVGIFLLGFIGQITKNRMNVAIAGACINVIGGCMLAFGVNTPMQYSGLCLFGMSPIPWIAMISLISSNTAGHTKKVVTAALLLIAYCVGNLVGPQTYLTREAPTYHTAKVLVVVCYAICLVLLLCMYTLNVWENKRRDRRNERLPEELHNAEFADLTDYQNPEFRYAM